MKVIDGTEKLLRKVEQHIRSIRTAQDRNGVIIGTGNHRAAIRNAQKIAPLVEQIVKINKPG